MCAGRIITNFVLVLLLSAWAVTCFGEAVQPAVGAETRIILVRHAERTEFTKVLTEKGRQRALDLVKAAADLNITAIYSPDLKRNLDTVKPLAQHLGVQITVTPARSTPLVDKIVDKMLHKHPGETILWVGNVSNLRQMFWRLGGDGEGPIDYGDLFIMKVSAAGPVAIKKTHFGM